MALAFSLIAMSIDGMLAPPDDIATDLKAAFGSTRASGHIEEGLTKIFRQGDQQVVMDMSFPARDTAD